ncbi:MAG TPA: hypothetical protein ENK54_02935 [Thiotrichales bacterium]|nr:hypothetical protein [Thiotrichales bacterium]
MDVSLKQRLTGAAVLVALAVIVIPWLLDGSGLRPPPEVPPPPASPAGEAARLLQEPIEPLPEREEHLLAPAAPETAPAVMAPVGEEFPVPAEKGEQVPSKRDAEAKGVLQSWVVQVASFEKQEKARELRDRLRKEGLEAFVEPYRLSGEHILYRVRVGPFLDLSQAREAKIAINRRTGLHGYVAPHGE